MSRNDAVTAGRRPAPVPAPVRTIAYTWIPMPDGTRLAARIWLPEDAETAPVPAILDFLPYRQGDLMAARDADRRSLRRSCSTGRSPCSADIDNNL